MKKTITSVLFPKDLKRDAEAKAAANSAVWEELRRIERQQGAQQALARYLEPRPKAPRPKSKRHST